MMEKYYRIRSDDGERKIKKILSDSSEIQKEKERKKEKENLAEGSKAKLGHVNFLCFAPVNATLHHEHVVCNVLG